jgi:hypothetical protein
VGGAVGGPGGWRGHRDHASLIIAFSSSLNLTVQSTNWDILLPSPGDVR